MNWSWQLQQKKVLVGEDLKPEFWRCLPIRPIATLSWCKFSAVGKAGPLSPEWCLLFLWQLTLVGMCCRAWLSGHFSELEMPWLEIDWTGLKPRVCGPKPQGWIWAVSLVQVIQCVKLLFTPRLQWDSDYQVNSSFSIYHHHHHH